MNYDLRIANELNVRPQQIAATIALFDEGLALAASIKTQLEEARLKVEQVIEKTEGIFSLESLDLS